MNKWLQQQIESIIREIITSERYDSLPPEEISQIAVELALFLSNILLSVLGALLVGLIAYILVNRHQTKSAQITKEIERQRLLHELEDGYQKIASTRCVWLPNKEGFKSSVTYNFTVALTREIRWLPPQNIEYDWDTGDRLVVFTADRDLISSSVLHEALFWFRRVHRAFVAKLLHPGDLYELWRQLLPFVTDSRYSFMVEYFGGMKRRGDEDVQAIQQVVQEVVDYCSENGKNVPLDYLDGRIDREMHRALPPKLAGMLKPAPG
ncbi:MAG: hypothetical protein HKN06_04540 [Gammaproteobacteria bacterium]|nr:hypothetical protein [Gammaproteobacteria bacterium]